MTTFEHAAIVVGSLGALLTCTAESTPASSTTTSTTVAGSGSTTGASTGVAPGTTGGSSSGAADGASSGDADTSSGGTTGDELPPYLGVYPGEHWEERTPAEVGLADGPLVAIAQYMGGRGVIVRDGYLVFSWGDVAAPGDLASSFKPFNTHFLLRAIEGGRLSGLDARAVDVWPCLNDLNAAQGYPDREITFAQLATQTSGYGIIEAPGTAFDYNDWQMALFSDALVLGVFGVPSWDQADAQVFWPELGDVLQFEDAPTFLGQQPGRVRMSPRDHARFGLLYLAHGRWRDVQLVSAAQAHAVVSEPLPLALPRAGDQADEMCPGQRSIGSLVIPDNQSDHLGSYSWLWWVNGVRASGQRLYPNADVDVFTALGHEHGRRGLAVVPADEIVVAWNDTSLDQKPWDDQQIDPHPLDEVFRLLHEAVR